MMIPTFEQLIIENKDKIYRICRIYAVSPTEPEDLFQEVIYQTWKAFSTFEGKSKIGTWIYRIALNVCLSSKKDIEKTKEKTVRLDSIQFELASSEPDRIQQEKYNALHDCIYALNIFDQSIVILSLEDLPYKEIAKIMGLTENHVAVKMKRIRKELSKCITFKLK